MERPPFKNLQSGAEFNSWYWLKVEMVEICNVLGLPSYGRKFDLRDRIMYALDNDGELKPRARNHPGIIKSKFDWANATLNIDTIITDNVSFGPNFRNFMKTQIGSKFSCHTDFMAWVKLNPGKSLKEAIAKYIELENRKRSPNFKRKIAANNMYSQYTRDFIEDNPGKKIKDAGKFWMLKKRLPTKDGFIKYERADLQLLK